ncbi:MAG: hypothetical protein K2H61_02670 [Muribaculaceae bacterium]|nr:hypothetical protein [Muribaculaceae bacterium]
MLVFTTYNVKTDLADMEVHRKGTTISGSAMSRKAGDTEADYEEITKTEADELRRQAKAEQEAEAEAEAAERARKERDAAIVAKIRVCYSMDEELAILRQRDVKPEEFEAYYDYVEQCKADVDEEIAAAADEEGGVEDGSDSDI